MTNQMCETGVRVSREPRGGDGVLVKREQDAPVIRVQVVDKEKNLRPGCGCGCGCDCGCGQSGGRTASVSGTA